MTVCLNGGSSNDLLHYIKSTHYLLLLVITVVSIHLMSMLETLDLPVNVVFSNGKRQQLIPSCGVPESVRVWGLLQ